MEMAPNAAVPEQVRHQVALSFDAVYAAINGRAWTDGVSAAHTILHLLEPYPLTAEVPWPVHIEVAWSLFLLGMAAESRGDLKDASSKLQRAASIAPGMWLPSPTFHALEQLGLVLMRLRNHASAAALFRQAIGLCGNEPQRSSVIWLYLGQAYEHIGDRREAVRAYHKALETAEDRELSDAPGWVHLAYGGIVRCSTALDSLPWRPFWKIWTGSGRLTAVLFLALVVAWSASMFEAASAVIRDQLQFFPYWVTLAVILLATMMLPVARKISLPGFVFESAQPAGPEPSISLPTPKLSEILSAKP